MALVNVSKPSTSLTNTTKIDIGLTWSANLLQWQNETRTWDDTTSTIDNITRITSTIINTSKPA